MYDSLLDFIYYNQFLVIILSIVIVFAAQGYLKNTFGKYSKIKSSSGLTGAEVAARIMSANGVSDVRLEGVDRTLGDHFDPKNKVVRLSPSVMNSNSIAAQAVAAHEIGHVLQYQQGSKLIAFRNAFLPLVQISSKGMWALIIGGIILQLAGLIYIGIAMFTIVLIFQVATLPVEFDASNRAMLQLRQLNLVYSEEEHQGVKKVLKAAALTYVVGVISSLLTLLRLLSNVRR